jgi:uncharacterized membrane-anchored protein
MIKILTACFLVLIPTYFVSAEDTSSTNTESETNQERLTKQNVIECVRALTSNYADLTGDEKKNFLSELELTEEAFERLRAWSRLDWKTEGKHPLPLSNSTISIPNGYALVTGRDAESVYTIEGEPASEYLEAYVCESCNVDNSVVFQSIKTGYISIDDWNEINSKELLEGIIQNTEEDNRERRKQGTAELHVVGWIQEPTLDLKSNTVYWAIEADSGEAETLVNSVAIRLGREGYEQITWITPRSAYVPFGGLLDTMLRAHSFDPGYHYTDYRMGDKLAGYGIATLVAGTVGGNLVKAGGIAMLLKKIGGLLIAGIAAAFYKLKNLFKRKKESVKNDCYVSL